MPKVSIMLITFNRVAYTRLAIESVLKQSFSDWEMIVVDDGSEEEEVVNLVKDFAFHDGRIKFYQNEHVDIPRVRSLACKYASGEYLAIIDSDDIWCDVDKLNKQVKFLDTHPEYVLTGSGVILIDKDGKEFNRYLNPEKDTQIRKNILYKNPIAHSSVLMRLSDVRAVGGYNQDLIVGEDYDLYLRLGKNKKMYNFPEYFIQYRRHDDNRSGIEVVAALKNNLKIIQMYKNDYLSYYFAYLRRICRLIIYQIFSIIRR